MSAQSGSTGTACCPRQLVASRAQGNRCVPAAVDDAHLLLKGRCAPASVAEVVHRLRHSEREAACCVRHVVATGLLKQVRHVSQGGQHVAHVGRCVWVCCRRRHTQGRARTQQCCHCVESNSHFFVYFFRKNNLFVVCKLSCKVRKVRRNPGKSLTVKWTLWCDVMRKVAIIISISSVCGVCGGVQRHTCVSPPTGSHPSAQYSRRCSEWTLLV